MSALSPSHCRVGVEQHPALFIFYVRALLVYDIEAEPTAEVATFLQECETHHESPHEGSCFEGSVRSRGDQ
jgi:hypothetical protein